MHFLQMRGVQCSHDRQRQVSGPHEQHVPAQSYSITISQAELKTRNRACLPGKQMSTWNSYALHTINSVKTVHVVR